MPNSLCLMTTQPGPGSQSALSSGQQSLVETNGRITTVWWEDLETTSRSMTCRVQACLCGSGSTTTGWLARRVCPPHQLSPGDGSCMHSWAAASSEHQPHSVTTFPTRSCGWLRRPARASNLSFLLPWILMIDGQPTARPRVHSRWCRWLRRRAGAFKPSFLPWNSCYCGWMRLPLLFLI